MNDNASEEHEPLLEPASRNDASYAADSEAREVSSYATESDTTTIWRAIANYEFKTQVVGVMFCFFVLGMIITAIGAQLIQLEAWYKIKDGTASLIFPTCVTGYIGGTILLPLTLNQSGWRGMVLFASVAPLAAILSLSVAPPFPLFLLSHFCAGLGLGVSDAGCNAWAGKLPYANVVQGLIHGSFSIGSIFGPIACVAVFSNGFAWYVYYRALAVLLSFQIMFLAYSFRAEDVTRYQSTHTIDEVAAVKTISRAKIVWMCGLFYFVYLGIEASFTNWVPAYMKRVRHVDSTIAPLATSSFWTGMAAGRFVLGSVTEHFGLNISVAVYIFLATILQIPFRFAQNLGLSLTLLGLIGFFYAPLFPSGIVLIGKKLSMQDYVGGVAAVVAIGQVGGAVSQVIVGFMAEKLGLEHLIDVVLFLSMVVLLVWAIFCRMK